MRLRNRLAGAFQLARGALQAQAPEMLAEAFADESAEDAVEVEPGECGDGRHFRERQIAVEVVLNVNQRADDTLLVVLSRHRLVRDRGGHRVAPV